jgi:hypothetical protein
MMIRKPGATDTVAAGSVNHELDLASLTHSDFADCTDQEFIIHYGDTSVATRLLNVAPWGDPNGQRQPFTLTFRGPNEPVLPQQIFAVESQRLGAMEIFLVPVGPDRVGMQYEAVFA